MYVDVYCRRVVLSLNNPLLNCIYLLVYCCWLFISYLNTKKERQANKITLLVMYIIYIYILVIFFFSSSFVDSCLFLIKVSRNKTKTRERFSIYLCANELELIRGWLCEILYRLLQLTTLLTFSFCYLWAYHRGISQRILIIILSLIRFNYYLKTKIDLRCPIWPYLHEIIQQKKKKTKKKRKQDFLSLFLLHLLLSFI